jgi:mono/diheme cytochrome c family protein
MRSSSLIRQAFAASVALASFAIYGQAAAVGQAPRPAKPAAGAEKPAQPAAKAEKPGAVDAEAIYKQRCQICHGPDGKGVLPGVASFPGGEWKHGSRVQDIDKVIRDGVPATTMTPFKGLLKPEEIEALAHYVRSFDKKLKPERSSKD